MPLAGVCADSVMTGRRRLDVRWSCGSRVLGRGGMERSKARQDDKGKAGAGPQNVC